MYYAWSMCCGPDYEAETIEDLCSKIREEKAKNLTGLAIHRDLVKIHIHEDRGVLLAWIPGMRWWQEDFIFGKKLN